MPIVSSNQPSCFTCGHASAIHIPFFDAVLCMRCANNVDRQKNPLKTITSDIEIAIAKAVQPHIAMTMRLGIDSYELQTMAFYAIQNALEAYGDEQ